MYVSKSVTRLVVLPWVIKKTLLISSVLVTVNTIVHFDVSMEIYHGEFSTSNVGHTR